MLNFPSYALKCLNTIKENGFEAYFVGGCVRDALIGRKYDDVDITTNATPSQIISIFEHTVPTGIAHGTITVIIEEKSIEVTTYRTEQGYSDSRHPDSVSFVTNLADDLSRRDFTVNSLAFDPEKDIVDLFGGIGDLNEGIIRAVGNPRIRFAEDALRIIRAFRFSSVLGMNIEQETKDAAFSLASTVQKVSGERVFSELKKLLCGTITNDFLDFINTGALASFGIYSADRNEDMLISLNESEFDVIEKTAIFISLIKHDTELIKTTLKPSSNFLNLINFLECFNYNKIELCTKKDIKRALKTHSKALVLAYVNRLSLYNKAQAHNALALISDIEQSNEPYKLCDLCINGNDLIKLGFKGKEIGKILDSALELVIDDPNANKKEILINKLIK